MNMMNESSKNSMPRMVGLWDTCLFTHFSKCPHSASSIFLILGMKAQQLMVKSGLIAAHSLSTAASGPPHSAG